MNGKVVHMNCAIEKCYLFQTYGLTRVPFWEKKDQVRQACELQLNFEKTLLFKMHIYFERHYSFIIRMLNCWIYFTVCVKFSRFLIELHFITCVFIRFKVQTSCPWNHHSLKIMFSCRARGRIKVRCDSTSFGLVDDSVWGLVRVERERERERYT